MILIVLGIRFRFVFATFKVSGLIKRIHKILRNFFLTLYGILTLREDICLNEINKNQKYDCFLETGSKGTVVKVPSNYFLRIYNRESYEKIMNSSCVDSVQSNLSEYSSQVSKFKVVSIKALAVSLIIFLGKLDRFVPTHTKGLFLNN